MNSIAEINRINQRELELGVKGSWHDQYKDSAYVFVGGLSYDLTEGDVITVFSQFGEIADINMPRDQETGKTKGFGFLMYVDQRSTVLAVDNMNGAQVVGRTIRVDHCREYRQQGKKNEEGDYVAPEAPTYNALPAELEPSDSESSAGSDADALDEDDPMAAYLRQEKKQIKGSAADKKKRKRGEIEAGKESKEERRRRKDERARIRAERERRKGGGSARGTASERDGKSRDRSEARGAGRDGRSPPPRQRFGEPERDEKSRGASRLEDDMPGKGRSERDLEGRHERDREPRHNGWGAQREAQRHDERSGAHSAGRDDRRDYDRRRDDFDGHRDDGYDSRRGRDSRYDERDWR